MWQWIGRALVLVAFLVLAASFAGELHGLGDSLAVFRPVILAGCILVSGIVWRWRGAKVLLFVAVMVSLWHGVGGWLHQGPKEGVDIVLYQKNLLYRSMDRTLLMDDIRESGADIVTLQEVSRANVPMLDALRDIYPYQLICEAHSVGAVAILSRGELTGEDCGQRTGFARAITQVYGQDVQVISLHLHWPWPYVQRQHAADLVAQLSPLDARATVVGGDFNMVASGRSLAWFEQATGTERVGPMVRTFDLFGYPLGIDHVLATGGVGVLDVRPRLGSDHYGVLALIELP